MTLEGGEGSVVATAFIVVVVVYVKVAGAEAEPPSPRSAAGAPPAEADEAAVSPNEDQTRAGGGGGGHHRRRSDKWDERQLRPRCNSSGDAVIANSMVWRPSSRAARGGVAGMKWREKIRYVPASYQRT